MRRRAPGPGEGGGVDLFRARIIGPLLRGPGPQRVLQWVFLLGYVGLVALGFGRVGIPGVPELHPLMYTHATTLLFWVLWFMGLVLLVPILGRAWCAVCPLGFATDAVGRRGLGLQWPRWVASGAGTVVLLGAGVAAVVGWEVHKSPHRTALVVAGIGLLALAAAAVFRRSAFCRGLCPVGSVLHLYSRHAPLAVRTLDPRACASCGDRSCTSPQSQWRRWDAGHLVVQHKVYASGCPVALYPPDMDQGACLLCLRCVRRCSQGNLGVFWGRRPPRRPLDASRTAALVLLLGLVAVALLRTWPDAWRLLSP
ncbi:MAG: 4Fe-4S binding protein, partial [Thermodesulfobacteriota bacterium]